LGYNTNIHERERRQRLSKLEKQKEALVRYFEAGCKKPGPLSFGLEVEHFITHLDGSPAAFAEIQDVMRVMQRQNDEAISIDGIYMGYYNSSYGISLEPACQLEISITPQTDISDMIAIYNEFYLRMGLVLADRTLMAHIMGYHPTCKAEDLPLIPKRRYQAMDEWFKTSGSMGIQMMRATASTQLSIDYYSEQDFCLKYRAACLLSPMLALLTDNAPIYQGEKNTRYSVRTMIWQNVDPARCGIPACLMDDDFGFAAYAEEVLRTPQIVAWRSGTTREVGAQTAEECYGPYLTRWDIEQILSMVFYDARLKNYIELRMADCMPPNYIAAYTKLIKTLFGSPASLENIVRRYAGQTPADIEAAKKAVCRSGYAAEVYGRPIVGELNWLMFLAKSRIPTPEERRGLALLSKLIADQKTIREEERQL